MTGTQLLTLVDVLTWTSITIAACCIAAYGYAFFRTLHRTTTGASRRRRDLVPPSRTTPPLIGDLDGPPSTWIGV